MGMGVRKCLLMIDTSYWKLTNRKEGLMLLGCLAWSSGLILMLFTERGIHSRKNVFREMMNFVCNVELEVPMGYPSRAIPE